MSPFATANMFCASQDGLRNLGFLWTVSTNIKVFCMVYDYVGKANLYKGVLKSKKKIGSNYTYFRGLNLERKCNILFCILQLFLELWLLNYL